MNPEPHPATRSEPAAPVRRAGARALGLVRFVIVVWVAVLVLYFQHKEGLINLSFGHAPGEEQTTSTATMRWTDQLLFAPSPHAGLFVTVLSNIPGDYRVWESNIPWRAIQWGLGMIALYLAVGLLFLQCFDVDLPVAGRACLALAMGTGLAGVAFELVTMAGLLYRWVVIGVWGVGLALLLIVLSGRLYRPRPLRVPKVIEDRGDGASIVSLHLPDEPMRPLTSHELPYCVLAVLLIGAISVLVLLHAVGSPETYWDSLILYIGYARKIFLQHAFPLKVTGQVGIGLGANYPHLYPLLTAQTATVAGFWSDMFAQLLPPIVAIASTVLVYLIVAEMSRDRVAALSAALLFRSVPYGIAYSQYASDYAVAIFFTAAFLYCALRYTRLAEPGMLALMLLCAAFAVHINYLMWILWVVAIPVVLLAHSTRHCRFHVESNDDLPGIVFQTAPRIGQLLKQRTFWLALVVSLAVSAPWYVRNVVVTGNPVYAFFSNVFPSKNVNPAVMRSAEVEWLLNGDGLGRAGRTLPEKLANSWQFFVTGPHHWKLAPVLMAFVMPGFLIYLIQGIRRLSLRNLNSVRLPRRTMITEFGVEVDAGEAADPGSLIAQRRRRGENLRFATVCALLFVLLWVYEYCVADFYLYQIIIVLPLFAVFCAFVFDVCSGRFSRTALCVLTLLVAFSPGVIMGLMGFKLKRSGITHNSRHSQLELTAVKNLFMDADMFRTMEFDGDMEMIDRVNNIPRGRAILTHENRHLLLDESLGIVHLDDWDVQKAYGKPPEDRLKILDVLGITYYLYVPNEDKHVANSWLGMDELIGLGYYKELFRVDSAGSSSREYLDYKNIPPDVNVLYRRSRPEDTQTTATDVAP